MRNHYVPQFLLNPWAEDNPDGKLKLFRLDLVNMPSSRHTPKYTGFDNDLYALTKEVVSGMEKHAIEKVFLKAVDNDGALVRKKLVDHGLKYLASEDRVNWARFLMSLRLRQPDVIQELQENSANLLKESLGTQPEQYEELASVGDPKTLEEWTETQFPGLIENFGLSFFHDLVDNAKYGNMILNMRWWIWDFQDFPFELLLSNHPCIFTSGIEDPDLIIALPISPKKAFMATQSERICQLMRQTRPEDLIVRINESSLFQSRVRIYARDASPRRFLENRLRKRVPSAKRKAD